MQIRKGATDQEVLIRIYNLDGTPNESVDETTVGLSLWYSRLPRGAQVAITPAALASVTASHADGGIKHRDSGGYRLDIPDAACAIGPHYSLIVGGEGTNIVISQVIVDLINDAVHDDQLTAQAYTANTLTAENGTKAFNGAYLRIDTPSYKQLVQVVDSDVTVPTAVVLTVDPPFNPALSGTIVYSILDGARNPTEDLPDVEGMEALATAVSAIAAKTSQLTFTVANRIDANSLSVNHVDLEGVGTDEDPFRASGT